MYSVAYLAFSLPIQGAHHGNIASMIVSRSQFWQPFLLSILAVSVLSSKALHLFEHAHSIPPYNFVVYFPTFFIQDALLCIAIWLLLHVTSGVKSIVAVIVSGILA